MRKVVFDIETRNIFQEVGSNNPAALDLAVVGLYDYQTNAYSTFVENDLKTLWPIFETTDILITFNGDHFDIPILNKYYSGDLFKIKSLDLLREMQKSAGRRMKLDQIAEGTLGVKKSGNGLLATNLWKNGKFDEVKRYCLDDVKITKDLYEYALQNGKLFFKEGPHTHEIKLDTSAWDVPPSAGINFTLPF